MQNKFLFKEVEEHAEKMMATLPDETVCGLYEHHLLNLALETMPYMPELIEEDAVEPIRELHRHTSHVVKLIERIRPVSLEVRLFVVNVKMAFKILSARQTMQNVQNN
jgi:hypothetical protein